MEDLMAMYNMELQHFKDGTTKLVFWSNGDGEDTTFVLTNQKDRFIPYIEDENGKTTACNLTAELMKLAKRFEGNWVQDESE